MRRGRRGSGDDDITDHRSQEPFQAILERKMHRMRFIDKPLLISEFGVKGPEDYQLAWLAAAARTIRTTPQIAGVCYFNLVDVPGVWGDIDAPDWSIGQAAFDGFTRMLLGPPPPDGAPPDT